MSEVKPCRKCGGIDRTPRGDCRKCKQEKEKLWYAKNRDKKKAWVKRYAAENPPDREKQRANSERWRNRHPGRAEEVNANSYLRNKPMVRHRSKEWYKNHPEIVAAKAAKRRSRKLQATPAWANDFFIKEIYHLAKLRSKLTEFKWHVDHIVPLNSKIVCGLHVEFNLRVIPEVSNLAKSNKFWPDMP